MLSALSFPASPVSATCPVSNWAFAPVLVPYLRLISHAPIIPSSGLLAATLLASLTQPSRCAQFPSTEPLVLETAQITKAPPHSPSCLQTLWLRPISSFLPPPPFLRNTSRSLASRVTACCLVVWSVAHVTRCPETNAVCVLRLVVPSRLSRRCTCLYLRSPRLNAMAILRFLRGLQAHPPWRHVATRRVQTPPVSLPLHVVHVHGLLLAERPRGFSRHV
ncbi:hypothetical protein TRVL_02575 [Trypanosoma vivax]|nr:hypothetical protein TRVL_02575 [Trypanosoma vivax]